MLKDLFNHGHFQAFPADFSSEECGRWVKAVERMVRESNIEAEMNVTEDGIEFGFPDQENANIFRLNMMALEGDFGAHEHMMDFEDPQDLGGYASDSAMLAAVLDLKLDMHVHGNTLTLDFERSEDWVIFTQAMDALGREGMDEAIRHGKFMQGHMRDLRAQLGTIGL